MKRLYLGSPADLREGDWWGYSLGPAMFGPISIEPKPTEAGAWHVHMRGDSDRGGFVLAVADGAQIVIAREGE